MRTARVRVLPYDLKWKWEFEKIKAELEAAIGEYAVAIEHVGSTAVEGLSAKPCIDIDVVIEDYSVLDRVVDGLRSIGYVHEGDLGIKGREAFKYTDKPHFISIIYTFVQRTLKSYEDISPSAIFSEAIPMREMNTAL